VAFWEVAVEVRPTRARVLARDERKALAQGRIVGQPLQRPELIRLHSGSREGSPPAETPKSKLKSLSELDTHSKRYWRGPKKELMGVVVRVITAVALLAGSTTDAAYVAWRFVFDRDAWLSFGAALMFVGTVTLTYAGSHWALRHERFAARATRAGAARNELERSVARRRD
jgi:hypothetical protein